MSSAAIEPPLYTRAEVAELGAQRLSFSWPLPSQVQTVALGGVLFRVRATYKNRLGSWYIDVEKQDGTPVLMGRRVTPGWLLNAGHHPDGEPAGALIVSDVADPYPRDALSRELTVTFYPTDGLKPPPPDDFAATAVDIEGV